MLAATIGKLVGDDLPVGLRAWDGSEVPGSVPCASSWRVISPSMSTCGIALNVTITITRLNGRSSGLAASA